MSGKNTESGLAFGKSFTVSHKLRGENLLELKSFVPTGLLGGGVGRGVLRESWRMMVTGYRPVKAERIEAGAGFLQQGQTSIVYKGLLGIWVERI